MPQSQPIKDQADAEPELVEEPAPKQPSGKRAKRLQEDRMRRPSEDR